MASMCDIVPMPNYHEAALSLTKLAFLAPEGTDGQEWRLTDGLSLYIFTFLITCCPHAARSKSFSGCWKEADCHGM